MSCLIVGAGISGIVAAEQLSKKGYKVTIIEKRDHIGGNCYDYLDEQTGILVNKYGAHLFHTNNEEVWAYVNSFDKWIRWEHKVISSVDGQFVPMPVNITTVNMLCDQNIKTENEMKVWLSENQIPCNNPVNSEETALSRIGPVLYDKLVKEYTYNQWNKYPDELDKSVLERIPVRCDFDCRYFTDKYQALPAKGYTHFFQQMLNPNIRILLNTDYFSFSERNFDFTIFTGPIDSYFPGEKLEYRSIQFHKEIIKDTHFYQPNSVVNYPSNEVPFTRIVEYKHFLNQKSKDTIIFKEISCSDGEPYYPVLNKKNLELYKKYKLLAEKEESRKVFFIGRLANYKYFNMDEAILNSLNFIRSLGSRFS